jgi:hypothetical protein
VGKTEDIEDAIRELKIEIEKDIKEIGSCLQIIDLILYNFESIIILGHWNHF